MAVNRASELVALTAAIEAPLAHFDYWLGWSGAASAGLVQEWVDGLVGRQAASDRDVLRQLVLTLQHPEPGEVKRLAEQHGVTPAAITQRRVARLAAIDAGSTAREGDGDHRLVAVSEHPLTELCRWYARRAVRLDDLPEWMHALLEPVPPEAEWGCAHDVSRALVAVALGRPRLTDDADGRIWLIDQRLLANGDTRPQFRELAEVAADRIAGIDYRVLAAADLDDELVAFGVSPRSTDAFRQQMQSKPVRRTIEYGERVLVMSAATSKKAGTITELVMRVFDLSQRDAVDRVAEAQARNTSSIVNDLKDLNPRPQT